MESHVVSFSGLEHIVAVIETFLDEAVQVRVALSCHSGPVKARYRIVLVFTLQSLQMISPQHRVTSHWVHCPSQLGNQEMLCTVFSCGYSPSGSPQSRHSRVPFT